MYYTVFFKYMWFAICQSHLSKTFSKPIMFIYQIDEIKPYEKMVSLLATHTPWWANTHTIFKKEIKQLKKFNVHLADPLLEEIALLGIYLYQFSIAVIMHHHQLGGSKQHPFIMSKAWRSEVWLRHGSAGASAQASRADSPCSTFPKGPWAH